MGQLLDALIAKSKEYTSTEEETTLIINRIMGTKDPKKVIIKTNSGDFFIFTDAFPKGIVPVISKPLKTTALLRQKGEYTNIISISYDTEELGKYNMVSSYGNAVVL
jgi:hypothetical protein